MTSSLLPVLQQAVDPSTSVVPGGGYTLGGAFVITLSILGGVVRYLMNVSTAKDQTIKDLMNEALAARESIAKVTIVATDMVSKTADILKWSQEREQGIRRDERQKVYDEQRGRPT